MILRLFLVRPRVLKISPFESRILFPFYKYWQIPQKLLRMLFCSQFWYSISWILLYKWSKTPSKTKLAFNSIRLDSVPLIKWSCWSALLSLSLVGSVYVQGAYRTLCVPEREGELQYPAPSARWCPAAISCRG